MFVRLASLFFFIHLAIWTAAGLTAEPIERKQNPAFLDMPLRLFLERTQGREERPEKGQFKEERRFHAAPSLFAAEARDVICDFYKERLFRIEIDYRPIPKARAQEIRERLLRRYGPPRQNIFHGTQILFWDDGKTRLVFQEEEREIGVDYSMTYLDDLLFHQASRERVRKEITPRSP